MTSTLAYSTTTGQRNTYLATGQLTTRDEVVDLFTEPYEPYCFVCGRCTDHIGEHEALVEAGMAIYDCERGYVRRTESYNREQAIVIAEAEYQAYCLTFA